VNLLEKREGKKGYSSQIKTLLRRKKQSPDKKIITGGNGGRIIKGEVIEKPRSVKKGETR